MVKPLLLCIYFTSFIDQAFPVGSFFPNQEMTPLAINPTAKLPPEDNPNPMQIRLIKVPTVASLRGFVYVSFFLMVELFLYSRYVFHKVHFFANRFDVRT